MINKLFSFIIEEQNGEQEYTHTNYVLAKDLKEATKFARHHCKNWYYDGRLIDTDTWSNFIIEWRLENIIEITQIPIDPINGERFFLELSDAKY